MIESFFLAIKKKIDMPQTDLLSFPSTIFFLLLTFLGGYLLFVSYVLPDLLFIAKARTFLAGLTLKTSQQHLSRRANTLLESSKSAESNFIGSKLAAFCPYSAIVLTFEDFLLAVNFLNLVLILYYVLRDSLYTSQLESSKLLVKPLLDLRESTYKISEASNFYTTLKDNLRSELAKPLLVQSNLWCRYRSRLYYRPIAAVIAEITLEVINEYKSILDFSRNKNLLRQVKLLRESLNA